MKYERKYTLKKAAAAALAVMISLSVFGVSNADRMLQTDRVVITGAAAEKDEKAEYDRQLAELENKKAELDRKIASAGSDIRGKQAKLDAVNEKAEVIKKKIEKVAKKTAELEDEMVELDTAILETNMKLEKSKEDIGVNLKEFKERLRAMYVAGNESYSEVLINAESFYDVLMRIELVKRVAEHDNETIDLLLEQKEQIEAYQAKLEKQNAELLEKSREYGERYKDLTEQQSELLKMQKEYGDSIKALQGDLSKYVNEAASVSGEYDRVAEKARTATTTTMATTAAPQVITDSDNNDSDDSGRATTTRRSSSDDDNGGSDNRSSTTRRTTTAASEDPDEPDTTTTTRRHEEPATTTTRAPETTTTTTTTTPAPEPEPEPEPQQNDDAEYKRNVVVNYAKGMVGGSYVWAGENYAACDCSGLVLLSYRQIGINLPHLAQSQAGYGWGVSRNELLPGDLIFFGSWSNIYHVAMYIGDGRMVHAANTSQGIIISNLDSWAVYNPVVCYRRLI